MTLRIATFCDLLYRVNPLHLALPAYKLSGWAVSLRFEDQPARSSDWASHCTVEVYSRVHFRVASRRSDFVYVFECIARVSLSLSLVLTFGERVVCVWSCSGPLLVR